MKKILLQHCRLSERNTPVSLLIEKGVIKNIGQYDEKIHYDEIIDLKRKQISPGFIDLHVHGAGGGEFYKADPDEIEKATSTLIKYGITAITPTTLVNPGKDLKQLHQVKDLLDQEYIGTEILGIHLEGPFVNPKNRGGIPATSVLEYDKSQLLKIIKILGDKLRMMTIAPEISPNMEIIDILLAHNIVPALGHTNIDYENAHKAFNKGLNHVTHMFNAMPPMHHRDPGPLLAIFERKDVSVQIIADGVHLNPAIVRFLYNTLGIGNCICVSDGQSVIGLPDGKYNINGGLYLKDGEKVTDFDDHLIGTALDLGTIGQKFRRFTGCSEAEAIQSVSFNPAKVLGLDDQLGSIEPGKTADLVVSNEDGMIEMVFKNGELIYNIT